jgi:hypothetical protein
MCSGAKPSLALGAATAAPCPSSSAAQSNAPPSTAACNGVHPISSAASTSAPPCNNLRLRAFNYRSKPLTMARHFAAPLVPLLRSSARVASLAARIAASSTCLSTHPSSGVSLNCARPHTANSSATPQRRSEAQRPRHNQQCQQARAAAATRHTQRRLAELWRNPTPNDRTRQRRACVWGAHIVFDLLLRAVLQQQPHALRVAEACRPVQRRHPVLRATAHQRIAE